MKTFATCALMVAGIAGMIVAQQAPAAKPNPQPTQGAKAPSVEDHDAELERRDEQLAELDERAAERDEEFAERDQKFAERDQEFAERDQEFAERDQEFAERDHWHHSLRRPVSFYGPGRDGASE